MGFNRFLFENTRSTFPMAMLTIYPQSLFIGILLGLYLALLMHLYRAGYRLGLLQQKLESGRLDEDTFRKLYGEEMDRSKLVGWSTMLARKMGRGRSLDEYIERAKEGLEVKGMGVEKEGFGADNFRDVDGFEKAQLLV